MIYFFSRLPLGLKINYKAAWILFKCYHIFKFSELLLCQIMAIFTVGCVTTGQILWVFKIIYTEIIITPTSLDCCNLQWNMYDTADSVWHMVCDKYILVVDFTPQSIFWMHIWGQVDKECLCFCQIFILKFIRLNQMHHSMGINIICIFLNKGYKVPGLWWHNLCPGWVS